MKIKEITNIRVRFNETDSLGIVWHGNYISYFEDGREDFGKKHNISYLDVKENGYITPIVESVCQHKLPLRYGDIATIETTFEDTPAAKMIFTYKIFNPIGEVVCEDYTFSNCPATCVPQCVSSSSGDGDFFLTDCDGEGSCIAK